MKKTKALSKYDNEARTYLRALLGIENEITDQDVRDAIAHVRRFLQDKNRIKLNK
jgi:hypothetical protein